MTPRRIRKGKKGQGTVNYTPRMAAPNVEGPRPRRQMTEIKKDARTQIVQLNSKKLKNDITEVYEEMKAKGIDGNSGTAGFLKNRMELDAFIEQAKKDGLTNEQALARFKKQYKL